MECDDCVNPALTFFERKIMKEPVTSEDKQELANRTIQLIHEFNELLLTKDLDTFDLRDIRKLIYNECSAWELNDFQRVFTTMWKVWPED
jgi:hypothetical protein